MAACDKAERQWFISTYIMHEVSTAPCLVCLHYVLIVPKTNIKHFPSKRDIYWQISGDRTRFADNVCLDQIAVAITMMPEILSSIVAGFYWSNGWNIIHVTNRQYQKLSLLNLLSLMKAQKLEMDS